MADPFALGIRIDWLILVVWWGLGLRGAKAAARSEPAWKQALIYWLPLALAFYLLGPGEWFGDGWLREQILPHTVVVYGLAFAVATGGVALACWSRWALGSNWSSVVQVKQDHELVQRGPYRWIRHPIYTGVLLMFVGSAIKVGDVRAPIAVVLVFASFWNKLRREEAWLEDAFGPAYVAYRRRTRALIPWLL